LAEAASRSAAASASFLPGRASTCRPVAVVASERVRLALVKTAAARAFLPLGSSDATRVLLACL